MRWRVEKAQQVGALDKPTPQAGSGEVDIRLIINNLANYLFHLMVMNETHLITFGAIGTGKSTLIKNALMNVPSGYTVVVFDIMGNYEGFTDYHAPYPFNPVSHLGDLDVLDVIEEAISMRFPKLPYAMTPAMEQVFISTLSKLRSRESMQNGREGQGAQQGEALEDEVSISRVIRQIDEDIESGALSKEDEVNSARGLKRRLLYFDHWVFRSTHPLINRLFRGELRGRSVGINLSWLSPIQRWFYVLSFLAAVNAAGAMNIIFVIDEAHLYFRLGESTLTASVRIGRNYNRYFALISQSINDIPDEFINMNKLFVEFPIMYMRAENIIFGEPNLKAHYGRDAYYDPSNIRELPTPPHWKPLTARIHLHVTNQLLYRELGEAYYRVSITVNPEVPRRASPTTLTKCAEAVGIEPGIIKSGGFVHKKYANELWEVWQCIGRP